MDAALGALLRGLFALMRVLGSRGAPAIGAFLTRTLGPLTSYNRIARDNIAASFPDRDEAWCRAVLREAWDNLGRTTCEYVHMETIWDYDPDAPSPDGRILIAPEVAARFLELAGDGKPALIFAAHLANWELPMIAAAKCGLPAAALYRTPNIRAVAREILALRKNSMGELIPAGPFAPLRMASALERGLHVGMLIDQRFGRGPRITFLGREAAANPLIAQLARRFDCPVHGARAIRLPNGRFRLDLTDALDLPRDVEGLVDVPGATAAMNQVVEGWIREHPGQWLWMHRKWR
ncbi:lipid A biosynthesis lauroyl acyltransferase [Plastoroseomonas arctica]|uniref:Lipid A biosynthesis lauroyl acyltransferase n=1 Tax=Plastoroseomonas arctica TaxID=1509237 RepID=A0AAF1KRK0_9PROT|nr:lipid A biosynthesis lauroyl acyltransferase [Plastoroseomonas arctica]MBR0654387.1 lipid A biosynthesis lauroyl acyltransferase [Plastoroseomonas arctica]